MNANHRWEETEYCASLVMRDFLSDTAASVTGALDVFFPRHCAGCGGAVDRPSGHVCWDCFRRIELHQGSACDCCGLKLDGEIRHAFLCTACRERPPHFDRARSAGRFRGVLRDLLHQFKYGQATWLGSDLAEFLHGCVLAHFAADEIDLVVPVPLHRKKLRDRGYNQAALLAGVLAARLGRPCAGDVLARVRATPTQTRLHADDRRRNVRGAFAARAPGWVRGRTVLLVDDVMTTGATLGEAADTLKRAGAWRVWAATVARG
jgi:ComF family protein